jgi:glycosyltransferase involved in cell wall biosynthesis
MKKILYIAYYFPPYQLTDSFRVTRVAKYLPKNGIKPIILTGYDGNHHWVESTLESLPQEVEINRISNPISFKQKGKVDLYSQTSKLKEFKNKILMFAKDMILSPDIYLIWTIKVLPTAIKLIKKHNIKHVMICIGPYSPALLGYFLKKLTGVSYSLDYRDEWRTNYAGATDLFERKLKPESLPRKLWNNFWEKRCVENAKNVFTVSEFMTNNLKRFYPKQKRLYACYNGFIDKEYNEISDLHINDSEVVNFYYAGKFDIDSLDYNPVILLKGFEKFLDKSKKKCYIHVYGDITDQTANYIKKYKYSDNILLHGRLKREKLLHELNKADYFIHFYYPDLHPEALSLKVFEYVFLRKPIASFSNMEGEMASFIESTNSGYKCWGNDVNEAAKLFSKILTFPKERLMHKNRINELDKYNFEKIIKFMSEKILEEI